MKKELLSWGIEERKPEKWMDFGLEGQLKREFEDLVKLGLLAALMMPGRSDEVREPLRQRLVVHGSMEEAFGLACLILWAWYPVDLGRASVSEWLVVQAQQQAWSGLRLQDRGLS
jgi:hypothetical protein